MAFECPLCGGKNTKIIRWIGEATEERVHDAVRMYCTGCKEFTEKKIGKPEVTILDYGD